MNVDTEALGRIRFIRAHTDPIPARNGLAETDIPDPVVHERLDTLADLTTTEPRRVAPWGDLCFHLSHESLSSGAFVQSYHLVLGLQYAFDQFTDVSGIDAPQSLVSLDQFTGADALPRDAQAELLQYTPYTPADIDRTAVLRTISELRHVVAWHQHQLFLDQMYDELPDRYTDGVPKAFWKQRNSVIQTAIDAATQSDSDENDTTEPTNNQAALTDF